MHTPRQTSTEAPIEFLSLAAQLEALLFAAPGPVAVDQLAAALEIPAAQVMEGLAALEERLETGGLRLQRFHNRLQLTTAPEMAPLVERFLGLEATSRLSQAALEALAVIAYRHPVTRPQIDAVRGVNSDGVLKSLLSKGLIEEAGRADGPGRPILYSISAAFLQHFGLKSLEELPPLEQDDASDPAPELLKD